MPEAEEPMRDACIHAPVEKVIVTGLDHELLHSDRVSMVMKCADEYNKPTKWNIECEWIASNEGTSVKYGVEVRFEAAVVCV
jgi:hypothetical protein